MVAIARDPATLPTAAIDMNHVQQSQPASIARSVDVQVSSVSLAQVGTWEVLDTTLGQDQFLVGPSPSRPDVDALAVFPPGTKVVSPRGSEDRVSSRGWRIAIWPTDSEGNRYTDVGEPIYLCQVELSLVIGLIETECPEHLGWLAGRLILPITNACAALRADRVSGGRVPLAAQWCQEAEFLLDELDIAVAKLPVDGLGAAAESAHACKMPDGLSEDSVEAWLPRDPGRWDSRLRAGNLRAIYEQQRAEAEGVALRPCRDDD